MVGGKRRKLGGACRAERSKRLEQVTETVEGGKAHSPVSQGRIFLVGLVRLLRLVTDRGILIEKEI